MTRDEVIQCLLSTQGQSEGVTADAILSLFKAAPAAKVPEGWRIVPESPTANMKSAASKLFARKPKATPAEYYKEMLTAAPQPVEKHTRSHLPKGVTRTRNASTGDIKPAPEGEGEQ